MLSSFRKSGYRALRAMATASKADLPEGIKESSKNAIQPLTAVWQASLPSRKAQPPSSFQAQRRSSTTLFRYLHEHAHAKTVIIAAMVLPQEFNRDLSIHVIKTFTTKYSPGSRARHHLLFPPAAVCHRYMPDPNDVFGKRHARRTLIRTGQAQPGGPAPAERVLHDPASPEFDRETQGINVLEALAASGLRSIR